MGLIYYIDEIVRWANLADKRIAKLEKEPVSEFEKKPGEPF
jgi:hypothetical protein